MKCERIVVHPGTAHVDDLLCCGLIREYFRSDIPVERRAIQHDDLQNPDVWVCDTGGSHDTDLHNFDHHGVLTPKRLNGYHEGHESAARIEKEKRLCPAAVILVLDYMKKKEKDGVRCQYLDEIVCDPYLKEVSFFDIYGKEVGVAAGLRPGRDMLVTAMLRLFENTETQEQALAISRAFWRDRFEVFRQAEYAIIARSMRYGVMLPGDNVDPSVWVYEWKEKGLPDGITLKQMLLAERKHFGYRKGEPLVSVYDDDRGDGWCCYTESMNFSQLKKKFPTVVNFSHQGGFIFNTFTKIPLEELVAIITQGEKK